MRLAVAPALALCTRRHCLSVGFSACCKVQLVLSCHAVKGLGQLCGCPGGGEGLLRCSREAVWTEKTCREALAHPATYTRVPGRERGSGQVQEQEGMQREIQH